MAARSQGYAAPPAGALGDSVDVSPSSPRTVAVRAGDTFLAALEQHAHRALPSAQSTSIAAGTACACSTDCTRVWACAGSATGTRDPAVRHRHGVQPEDGASVITARVPAEPISSLPRS